MISLVTPRSWKTYSHSVHACGIRRSVRPIIYTPSRYKGRPITCQYSMIDELIPAINMSFRAFFFGAFVFYSLNYLSYRASREEYENRHDSSKENENEKGKKKDE